MPFASMIASTVESYWSAIAERVSPTTTTCVRSAGSEVAVGSALLVLVAPPLPLLPSPLLSPSSSLLTMVGVGREANGVAVAISSPELDVGSAVGVGVAASASLSSPPPQAARTMALAKRTARAGTEKLIRRICIKPVSPPQSSYVSASRATSRSPRYC